MSIVINIIIIGFLCYKSKSWFVKSSVSSSYYYLLAFKIGFGLTYALIYSYYYIEDNDSKCYHHDGQVFSWYFWHEPIRFLNIIFFDNYECETQIMEFWMRSLPRAFFFSKFISIFYIIFSTNYWIITIYTSLLSFLGTYYMVNVLSRTYKNTALALVIAFLLWPNIQLWTSGLLKESLALAAMYMLIAFYFDRFNKLWIRLLIAVFCIWFIWEIKYYYLVIIPFLALHYMFNHTTISKRILVLLIFFGMLFSFIFGNSLIKHMLLTLLYSHDVSYYTMYHPNSNNHFGDITLNAFTLFKNAPEIIFKGIFSPMQLPEISLFRTFESLSNLVILFLTIWSFTCVFLYNIKVALHSWLLMCFIVFSAFVVGSTVPNFGALVRIRVFYESFVILLSLYLPSMWVQKNFKIFNE